MSLPFSDYFTFKSEFEFKSSVGGIANMSKSFRENNQYKDLFVFFDLIFIIGYGLINDKNMETISLLAPLHIAIAEAEEDERLVIAITDEKAVLSNTSLMSPKAVTSTVSEATDILKRMGKDSVGVKFKYFTTIKRTVFEDLRAHFDILIKNKNARERWSYAFYNREEMHSIHACALELVENIEKEDDMMMNINPIFKARNLQIDQSLVFGVLPFEEKLEFFKGIVRPEIEKNSMEFITSESIFSRNDIMEDIWTYICKSKFVVADISHKNPNVFYELGICHSIGKEVIILCDQESLKEDYAGKLPFDVTTKRMIIYSDKGVGVKDFEQKLGRHIESILTGKVVFSEV